MGCNTLNEEQLEFFKDEISIDTSNGVRVCHKCGIEKPIKSFKIRFNNNHYPNSYTNKYRDVNCWDIPELANYYAGADISDEDESNHYPKLHHHI